MAENEAKKVANIDDLKVVIDDIYSRLDKMASKEDLREAIRWTKNNLDTKIYYGEALTPSDGDSLYVRKMDMKKPKMASIIIKPTDWDNKPKQKTINNSAIDPNSFILFLLPIDTSTEALQELSAASITINKQNYGNIVLDLGGEKPTKNIKLNLIIL